MASLVWAIVAAALFVGQFATGMVDFLFPAVAAIVMAVLSFVPIFGDLYWLQALVWMGMSVVSVVWLRKKFPSLFNGKIAKLDRFEHSGKEARVLEAIRPGQPGRITYQGTSWTALSSDETIAVGQTVSILEQDGLSFIVSARSLIGDESSK